MEALVAELRAVGGSGLLEEAVGAQEEPVARLELEGDVLVITAVEQAERKAAVIAERDGRAGAHEDGERVAGTGEGGVAAVRVECEEHHSEESFVVVAGAEVAVQLRDGARGRLDGA